MRQVDDTSFLEHRLETALGPVLVRVAGSVSFDAQEISLDAFSLPKGMHIDGLQLLRIELERAIEPSNPLLLQIVAEPPGSAETGEHLESIAFERREGLLQVGLRDCEWLESSGISASWASYRESGLEQEVTVAPKGASIFVSVAWLLGPIPDRRENISTWYAADLALPWGPDGECR